MNDLQKAKELLMQNEFTCVLCKGESIITCNTAGISPVLDLIHEGRIISGYSLADKIVGKAAAMLFVYAGIKAVHAQVLSEKGAEVLREYGIEYTCDKKTQYIINRKGDGMCPMEETVLNINEPETAYRAIYHRREQLRKDGHK